MLKNSQTVNSHFLRYLILEFKKAMRNFVNFELLQTIKVCRFIILNHHIGLEVNAKLKSDKCNCFKIN